MAENKSYETFYNIFIEALQDIYSAEDQYAEAMPKILAAIHTDELRSELNEHYEEAKSQREKLLKICGELNVSPTGTFSDGMKGLLRECDKIVNKELPGVVKDAALIGALQKCKHYEIATYGTLRTFAKHLDLTKIQETFQDILDDEWNTDKTLTGIAEGGWFKTGINIEASR